MVARLMKALRDLADRFDRWLAMGNYALSADMLLDSEWLLGEYGAQ